MAGYSKPDQANTWDFTKNPVLEGVKIRTQVDIGVNKSNLYTIRTLDTEQEVKVWGATALDTQMEAVEDGMQIKIEYGGMKPSPKRPGKSFKDFSVLVWKD